MSPAVREESPSDVAVPLTVREVEPGVFLKLSEADYQAHLDRKAADKATADAYAATVRGDASASSAAAPAAAAVPLTVLKKAELQDLASTRGLKTTGSKDDIAARIGAGSDEAEPADDPNATPSGEAADGQPAQPGGAQG